jgi:predicted DNA-binding transcriptional regulator AlpA
MAPVFEDWLTHKQVAGLLGISSRRLYNWRQLGMDIPPSYFINKQHRFRRSEVIDWLDSHRSRQVA